MQHGIHNTQAILKSDLEGEVTIVTPDTDK